MLQPAPLWKWNAHTPKQQHTTAQGRDMHVAARTPAHLDGHAGRLGEVPERHAEQAEECGLGLVRLGAAGTQDASPCGRAETRLSISSCCFGSSITLTLGICL